jgi:hypothetical protein
MPTDASRRMIDGAVLDVDEMELEVLPGGDMGDAVGVFLGQFGHDFELARIEPAEGNLDPEHAGRVPDGARGPWWACPHRELPALRAVIALAIVVALAVGAAAQPGLGKHLFVDLALLAQLDLGLELVDFAADGFGQLAFEARLPNVVAGFHENCV